MGKASQKFSGVLNSISRFYSTFILSCSPGFKISLQGRGHDLDITIDGLQAAIFSRGLVSGRSGQGLKRLGASGGCGSGGGSGGGSGRVSETSSVLVVNGVSL